MKTYLKFKQHFLFLTIIVTIFSACKKEESETNPTSKKDPVITWANPADIVYETLLSSTQLNATADVPGTFVYTPALNTKLAVGQGQSLTVNFTPTDVTNYNTASKTVFINVISGSGSLSSAIFNPNLTYGTITDQDGNTYKTITIGTQVWMAENLRTTKYRNGDVIPEYASGISWSGITTGAVCAYNNTTSSDTINTYGRLYNWYAATDSRGIAPTGWHVPTDAEWTVLTTFLGADAGNKLLETGTTHWTMSSSSTNESGFTALPNGERFTSEGIYNGMHNNAYFWTSTSLNAYNAMMRSLQAGNPSSYMQANFYKQYGFGIRCVKD